MVAPGRNPANRGKVFTGCLFKEEFMIKWITATVDLAVAASSVASFPVDYCHVM